MDNQNGVHVNTRQCKQGTQKGVSFHVVWLTVQSFSCPNEPSECRCWCQWHHNSTMMLMPMPMWWYYLVRTALQGRLCPKIRPFWLTVPEISLFSCLFFLLWLATNICNNVCAYFISFNSCYTWICHLSSPHQCATPHIWLECAWPDVQA